MLHWACQGSSSVNRLPELVTEIEARIRASAGPRTLPTRTRFPHRAGMYVSKAFDLSALILRRGANLLLQEKLASVRVDAWEWRTFSGQSATPAMRLTLPLYNSEHSGVAHSRSLCLPVSD